jgi:radical SAM superfamily enzyme YgiQ (UPF0313 family)
MRTISRAGEMMTPSFEQGPIRPPSEAGSLLLRFTRNCPWNKCTFCPVYKKREFSRRSLEEIRQDIDAVRSILDSLQSLSWSMGYGGRLDREVLNTVLTGSSYDHCTRQVAVWYFSGKGTVFIQDANSLILPTSFLVQALRYLKEKIPGISRVTSYARSSTLARRSLEELKEIFHAGLDRIHIGLESGSDRVLKRVKKGTTAKDHIDAGRKVIEAGMTLSEYIMPGLGGQDLSREHAVETARVLNAIDPHFIRLRSLRVPPHAPLYVEKLSRRFVPLSDDDTVREIRLFIQSLEGIHSTLTSDHIMNLLEEVQGSFPEDRQAMIDVIDRYLAMPPEEKLLFRLGRRGGALRSLDDLCNPSMRRRLESALSDLAVRTGSDVERIITELGDQYI